jgi:arylsulfatase
MHAHPETKAIGERVKAYMKKMPFNIKEYLEYDLPGSDKVGDWGE